MSINLYSRISSDYSYKLVQLTPDLLEALKEPDSTSKLHFKAFDEDKADVVLCSRDKTWLIKQKNHSNTVMLMREFVPESQQFLNDKSLFGMPQPTNDLLGYSKTTFEYETRLTEGRINLDLVPIYNGEMNFPTDESKLKCRTFSELLENSPSSEVECKCRWNKLGGCIVNGYPCILTADFISNALHVTLMSAMAESLDLENLTINETFAAVNKDMDRDNNPYTVQVVETILAKYGTHNQGDKWKLNVSQVAQWYGIRALRKYASKNIVPHEEFLIKWKSTFPPFSSFDIDIKMLRGWYFEPTKGNIQYISKDTLPMDIKDRFKMLFRLQSQWDLDDIVPFIEELNTKGMKIESFIMKYARRKRMAKRSVVTSR